MIAVTYSYTSNFGNGIILAPCLQALCGEIAQRYPEAVNLGEIGNAAHVTEGYSSDHNPFITHNGKRYVRAIDIGGPDSIQQALFSFIQAKYQAHDSRVWPYGYVHRDGVITTWFGTGTHPDPGDDGHLHISVTQANGQHPSPSGWVSALDRTDGWGLIASGDDLDMDTKTLQTAVTSAPIVNPETKAAMTLAARVLDIESNVDQLLTIVKAIKAKVGA